MKFYKIVKSQNEKDEYYTPKYAVKPIIKYLIHNNFDKIWCPFDTEESYFVQELKNHNIKVEYTHIYYGNDFFNMPTPVCDAIVSNPPYSLKTEILQSLFNREKPFAMLVGVFGLFESKKRFLMFKDNIFEVLYFDKRVAYFKKFSDPKPSMKPPFSSVYITHKILPKQICFEKIDNKDF